MSANFVKYVLIGLGVFVASLLLFSPKFRSELPIIWTIVSGSVVDKMEAKLDQGTLALVRFDEEYTKAEQKLISLRHLKLDAQYSLQRAQEKATQYRSQGKEDLARRNDEQVAFFAKQVEDYDVTIAKRSEKLLELKHIRELAREDVRLAQERIAMLQAMRNAMDSSGQEEMLQKAQENINNLQGHCNRLRAEIEVIILTN